MTYLYQALAASVDEWHQIPLLENDVVNMQAARYALRENLLTAKHLDAILGG